MKKSLFSVIIVLLVSVFAVPSAYASDGDFHENTKERIIYLQMEAILFLLSLKKMQTHPHMLQQRQKAAVKPVRYIQQQAPLCIPLPCMELFHTMGVPRRRRVPLTPMRKIPHCGVFQAVPHPYLVQPQQHPGHLSQP